MIRLELILQTYGWKVYCYFAKTCYYTDEIVQRLRTLGCKGDTLRIAQQNLSTCMLDTGLTYSNLENRESVMVVALTSSAEEYMNSFTHELAHLRRHIEKGCDIDPDSEEICYIAGEFARACYEPAHALFCPLCHKDERKGE